MFGLTLSYHKQDYINPGSGIQFVDGKTQGVNYSWSGDLHNMAWRTNFDFGDGLNSSLSYSFNYDVNSQLISATLSNTSAGSINEAGGQLPVLTSSGGYDLSQVSYDLNGNIQSLQRESNSGSLLDDFTYSYSTGNNKLNSLSDASSSNIGNEELVGNTSYLYDLEGKLTQYSNSNQTVRQLYNDYGKVYEIREAGDQHPKARYYYDEGNRRYKKEIFASDGSLQQVFWDVFLDGQHIYSFTEDGSSQKQESSVYVYGQGMEATIQEVGEASKTVFQIKDLTQSTRVEFSSDKSFIDQHSFGSSKGSWIWRNTSSSSNAVYNGDYLDMDYLGIRRQFSTVAGKRYSVVLDIAHTDIPLKISAVEVGSGAIEIDLDVKDGIHEINFISNSGGNVNIHIFIPTSEPNYATARFGIRRSEISSDDLVVEKAIDYYPFGMPLTGRAFYSSSSDTRRAYQGEFAQKDEETQFHFFEARQYDSRIGRWMSPDPLSQYYSPYVGMGNSPHNVIDPDGRWGSEWDAFWARMDNKGGIFNWSSWQIVENFDVEEGDDKRFGIKIGDKIYYDYDELTIATMDPWDRSIYAEGVENYAPSHSQEKARWDKMTLREKLDRAKKKQWLEINKEVFNERMDPVVELYEMGAGPSGLASGLRLTTVRPSKLNLFRPLSAVDEIAEVSSSLVPPYPTNPAVTGTTERVFLQTGQIIDRFGELEGRWFSVPGVSYGSRSIPPGKTPYLQFKVLKPFEVNKSLSTPGMLNGQTGFGIQYQSPVGADILLKRGIIAPL